MDAFEIITSNSLEYKDKINLLARESDNQLPYVDISDTSTKYLKDGIICDIWEGHSPFRPRYVTPDYSVYFKNGSKYLNILPPTDMYDAVNALMIIYNYIPSITTFPVYIGNLDQLLEPFVNTVDTATCRKLIKMLFTYIASVLPDGFVHANIGPYDSSVANIILDLQKEMKNAVPNISLKVSQKTPDDLFYHAIQTALEVGKPYFVNHDLFATELGENYCIASCYNTLKIGGGSHTLVRLNLKKLAETSENIDDFFKNKLPIAFNCLIEIINARAKFLVEKSNFFESCFLVRENLIDINNFTSMAGIFGLYECVEILSDGKKMGVDIFADTLAKKIVSSCGDIIKSSHGEYCNGFDGKIGLHAQSGIDSDVGVTGGVRFRSGDEPSIINQIKIQSELHQYFDTGVTDIYIFDKTAKQNIAGLRKIILGALKNNMKIMAINCSDSELIRISGYLVKKSDIKEYKKGNIVLESTVSLGSLSIDKCNVLDRKVRSL